MKHTTVVDAKSGVIQVTAELVIKNFVEVMAGFKPGRFIKSEPFNVGDTPMTIKVFLNGRDEARKGNVGVFLRNHGLADINVKCQLITEVETWGFGYEETVVAGHGVGLAKFLSHAKCAEAFKDKDFIVTAKVEIPGEPVKIFGIEPAPKKQKLKVSLEAAKAIAYWQNAVLQENPPKRTVLPCSRAFGFVTLDICLIKEFPRSERPLWVQVPSAWWRRPMALMGKIGKPTDGAESDLYIHGGPARGRRGHGYTR